MVAIAILFEKYHTYRDGSEGNDKDKHCDEVVGGGGC